MRYKYCDSKNNKTGGSKMKGKGSVKKALLQVLALMAEDEMEVNIYSWPPICAGILHQPERPIDRKNKEKRV